MYGERFLVKQLSNHSSWWESAVFSQLEQKLKAGTQEARKVSDFQRPMGSQEPVAEQQQEAASVEVEQLEVVQAQWWAVFQGLHLSCPSSVKWIFESLLKIVEALELKLWQELLQLDFAVGASLYQHH